MGRPVRGESESDVSASEVPSGALALGLIETRGLVGVLEAADTAAKAADVQLMGIERIGGGFVSLRLRGEVAAVQAAVRAGSAAARDVSDLVSAHVIPSPHVEMDLISSQVPSSEAVPAGTAISGAEPAAPEPVFAADTTSTDTSSINAAELSKMPVARLRQLVRRTAGVRLQGREVSRANKQQLLAELQRVLGNKEG